MERLYKWRKKHGASEDEVTQHPRCQQIWSILVQNFDQRCDTGRWSGSKSSFLVFRRLDKERKEYRSCKGNDGEYNKTKTSDAAYLAQGIGGLFDVLRGRVAHICLADPRWAVKKEGEPSYMIS